MKHMKEVSETMSGITGKLDDLFADESEEVKEAKLERKIFSSMYITKDALMKARLYATLSKDNSGTNIECYGYPIGNIVKKNRVIEDVYFAPNQTNGSAHTLIPAESVIAAGREIRERGKRVLGWWHSHANFQPFHSGTDDENLKTVLDQVAPSNYITIYKNMNFLDGDIKKTRNGNGGSVIVCDRNNSSKRLEMIFNELDENPLAGMPMEKLVVRIPEKICYAYSLVVNARGDTPYAEIAIRRFCNSCGRDEYESFDHLPLRVLDYDSGAEIDEKKMGEEVKTKLVLPRPRIIVPVIKFRKKDKKKHNRIVSLPPRKPTEPLNLVQVQTSGHGSEDNDEGGFGAFAKRVRKYFGGKP
jgi:proteasome lid subunit RPN8/RPN11